MERPRPQTFAEFVREMEARPERHHSRPVRSADDFWDYLFRFIFFTGAIGAFILIATLVHNL